MDAQQSGILKNCFILISFPRKPSIKSRYREMCLIIEVVRRSLELIDGDGDGDGEYMQRALVLLV